MEKMRKESDSMGTLEVPQSALYGAQTARSLIHFSCGDDKIPTELILEYAYLKKACAIANHKLGKLEDGIKNLIQNACDQIIEGKHFKEFPLFIYQTGSGTQTNMNLNEVISNLANLEAGSKLGSKSPVHPNDHVNMSQSSNDTFPTVMHMSALSLTLKKLIPTLEIFLKALRQKEAEFKPIIKIGRTHLMDAVPLSLGQEFSGYIAQIEDCLSRIKGALLELHKIPIGGSAIGTGLNTHKDFDLLVCQTLSSLTQIHFEPAKNKFSAIAAHDSLVHFSSTLKTLSCSLMKIAHDLAWMGSGPRCGLHELILPENEPGSSIMPGKVNPTQCEAICMVAAQVHGYDAAISMAGALGNFELNVYKPLIIFNVLKSINILSDSIRNFTQYFIMPLKANKVRIKELVDNSLMLVTALSPHIGYDKAAKMAHYAYEHNLSLKESGIKLGFLSGADYESLIDIYKMANL
jgi:fumarate hydratase class II